MKQFNLTFLLFIFLNSTFTFAQEDLLDQIEESENVEAKPVSVFKSTRIVNFHTTEILGRRTLDFRISHRFGEVNQGAYNLWGFDGNASIRIGLEYSHNGNLQFGIGRTSTDKQFDGFIKWAIMKENDTHSHPFSIVLMTSMFYTTLKDNDLSNGNLYSNEVNRFSYATQLMFSKKISDRFSVQLSPTWVHYNLINSSNDSNDQFALIGLGRGKITKRTSIIGEYAYRLTEFTDYTYYNSLSFGVELETGGHIFQITAGNSFGITENQVISYNTTTWANGGWRIGFNICRTFNFAKKDENNKIY
jgi:hypothetical protein